MTFGEVLMPVIEYGGYLVIFALTLGWVLLCVNWIQLGLDYGWETGLIERENVWHAFGILMVVIYIVFRPVNWWLYKWGHYIRRVKHERYRKNSQSLQGT